MARLLFTLAREKKDGHYLEALQPGDYWLQDLLAQYAGQKAERRGQRLGSRHFPVHRRHDRHPESGDVHPQSAGRQHAAMPRLAARGDTTSNRQQRGVSRRDPVLPRLRPDHGGRFCDGARRADRPRAQCARHCTTCWASIEKYKPTLFMGVPALYNAINNHPLCHFGQSQPEQHPHVHERFCAAAALDQARI